MEDQQKTAEQKAAEEMEVLLFEFGLDAFLKGVAMTIRGAAEGFVDNPAESHRTGRLASMVESISGGGDPGSQSLRGTGRTTRMLEHAIRLASQGTPVAIVAANSLHVTWMKAQLQRMDSRRCRDIRVVSINRARFDVERMGIQGDAGVEVLVDHAAIELRHAKMLEMLHRYDPGATGKPEAERKPWPHHDPEITEGF